MLWPPLILLSTELARQKSSWSSISITLFLAQPTPKISLSIGPWILFLTMKGPLSLVEILILGTFGARYKNPHYQSRAKGSKSSFSFTNPLLKGWHSNFKWTISFIEAYFRRRALRAFKDSQLSDHPNIHDLQNPLKTFFSSIVFQD